MGYKSHVKPDPHSAINFGQLDDGKVGVVVGDYAVRNAKSCSYLDDELGGCFSIKFFYGFCFTHFVNLSTPTKRCVSPPLAVRKGPTMSSPQTVNGK